MNEKQVKKWVAVSFILCYIFLMVPVIVGKLHTWVLADYGLHFVTIGDVVEKVVGSALMLSLLVLLVYSDNLLRWFEKTRVGKWILAPMRQIKKDND